jgi:hypothetical protein
MKKPLCTEEYVLEVSNNGPAGPWYLVRLFGIAAAAALPGVPTVWLWCIREVPEHGLGATYDQAATFALRAVAGLGLLVLQLALYLLILAVLL